MKILITGSNGLLGQKLTALLGNHPHHALVRTSRAPQEGAPGEWHPMDITDANSVKSVIDAVNPDAVIHAAAMTMVDDCEQQREACWKANVDGTQNVLQACSEIGAHVIHVSTDFIFDGSTGPLTEEAEPGPVNFYGESKLEAERLVMKYSGDWAILRTVLVYGLTPDRSRSNIVLWVKNNLEAGKPIIVVDDQWRTPTLAEDLAMGCLLAAEHHATGIYHVSGPEMLTPYDMAMQTAAYFGLDNSLITRTDSTQFTQPAKRPLRTGFIIDKARRSWGYAPRSFREGIEVMQSQMGSQA
ncbi:MAG: SDR family oxidoreductase [Bacteroidota bacterium]